MKYVLIALSVLVLTGCTDAEWSKVTSLGSRAHVVCYSGGKEIYNGESTGKILESTDSDGYNFRDAKTKDLVQVTGDCVVTYLE